MYLGDKIPNCELTRYQADRHQEDQQGRLYAGLIESL